MYEFRLPDVGEGIHEAELQEWLVEVGQTVDEGTPVAVINTDKVSVELPSPAGGVVSSLPWNAGDVLTVGQVLMVLDGSEPATPDHNPAASDTVEPIGSIREERTAPTLSSGGLGRPVAAPSTRKLALQLGVALDELSGSGPGGRILRSDVHDAADLRAAGADATASDDTRRERPTGVRGAMFRNMAESSRAAATTTSTFTVRMERVEELVGDIRSDATDAAPSNVGIFSIAAACVVRALTNNPRLNAVVDLPTGDLIVHRQVHLGIAVASPAGLVVPVLRNASALSLTALSDEIGEIAAQARDGVLGAAQMRGGTFTVSNTGGLERARVTSTQPILHMPQVAILWMSRIRDEPVVEHGVVRAGRQMSCSLSFDHRYIDGAEATGFINDLTELIERPVRVLL